MTALSGSQSKPPALPEVGDFQQTATASLLTHPPHLLFAEMKHISQWNPCIQVKLILFCSVEAGQPMGEISAGIVGIIPST
jgi:hypothetical protein